MTEAIEAEVVDEPGQDLEPVEQPRPDAASTALDGNPTRVMQRSAELAKNLKDFVTAQGLTTRFGDSEHLQVEAWQFIGSQIGVHPIPGIPEVTEDENGIKGYTCRTELVDHFGHVIGSGSSRCMRSEDNWAKADEYAVESMAQTRSIGKAFRNSYGFIAKAAGYSPTPAEEMDGVKRESKPGFASDKQKSFFQGLLKKAGAKPDTVDLITAFCSATMEGGRDKGISNAIDTLKDESTRREAGKRLAEEALAWQANQTDVPADEEGLDPVTGDPEEVLP